MPRYLIIANPASARGAGARMIPQIEKRLQKHHLDFELERTGRPWHAAELAAQGARDGFDVVAAAGGDGTSNEVLNGLIQARAQGENRPAMAVLPIGRGNDFAFSMGAPIDLEQSIQALVGLHTRTIDIGHVRGGDFPQGRYFGNGVGIGFDAVTGFEALKVPLITGFISYLWAAIRTIFIMKAPQVEIELDDEKLEQRSLLVSIMNGRRLGGGFWSAPHGIPDDGLFDLCIGREISKLQVMLLIPRFMNGTQAGHPAIHITRSRRVRVTAQQGSLAAHADGETLCYAGQELTLEVLPRMLELVVA
jgi:diacylglycerol kinase (ATP)